MTTPKPSPRPWVFCTCGNIVKVGTGLLSQKERVEHPACGREPNRIRIPTVRPDEEDPADA